MSLKTVEIKGMHCKSCKMLIEDIMDDLDSEVVSFDVDQKKQIGILKVETEKTGKEIADAIKAEGEYTVKVK